MNISKSSWHYRLLKALDWLAWPKDTLCKYFWKVVVACVFVPSLALLVSWLALLPFWGIFYNAPFPLRLFIATIEIIGLGILLGVMVSNRWDREIRAGTRKARPEEEYVYKSPSLLRQWLTAKHRKVCPIITFVEDDKS